jgi:mRNA-degrading endonuclease RelE of RelBE toxin-antitoxin system
MRYTINYSDDIINHLKHIPHKFWPLIKNTIKEQLEYEPNNETNNRKPLSHPPIDDKWEIRFGPNNCFRVFYKIFPDLHEVWILAIGTKMNNRLFIAGEEIEL